MMRVAPVLLVALLGACSPDPPPGFGAARAAVWRAEIVDADAHATPEPPPEGLGERAAAAWQRYRDGKTLRPALVPTSDVAPARQGGSP